LQRYEIFISRVKNFVGEKLFKFLWAGKNPLKNHNNLMHYFDVILLSDVIWPFGPKVTRRVTYFGIFCTDATSRWPIFWTLYKRSGIADGCDRGFIVLDCVICLNYMPVQTRTGTSRWSAGVTYIVNNTLSSMLLTCTNPNGNISLVCRCEAWWNFSRQSFIMARNWHEYRWGAPMLDSPGDSDAYHNEL